MIFARFGPAVAQKAFNIEWVQEVSNLTGSRVPSVEKRSSKRGMAMSTHVHRDGAHQITVSDETGREVVFISQGHALHITTGGEGPLITPQMAHELADELHRWASCQQTVRTKGTNGVRQQRSVGRLNGASDQVS